MNTDPTPAQGYDPVRVAGLRPPDAPAGVPSLASSTPGPSTATQADRLPRPPGRRRPGIALLGLLLVVAGAATAGLLAIRLDGRTPVLVARQDISVGQRIERDDLAVARVAAEGVQLIPADRASEVIGRYATARIVAGRLVDPRMLATSGLLTPERAAVGVALAAGRYPASGLESGDVVQVIRTVDGAGTVIAADAVIGSVSTPGDSVFGAGSGDRSVVTVIVPRADAPAVAAAGNADQVSLVLLSRGTALEPGG